MPTFHIEKTDSQYVVSWRYFTRRSFVVLFAVLAAFTIFEVFFLHLAFIQQEPTAIYLVLGFGFLWIIIFFVLLNALFGESKIVLDIEGLETSYTCLWYKRNKRRELADVRRFETIIIRQKGGATHRLRIVCQKKNVEFNFPEQLSKELGILRDQISDQLNIILGTLKAEVAGVPAEWELPEPILFELNEPPQHLEPPPRTRLQYQSDFNGVGFTKRGEDRVGDIIRSLIPAVFVNGVVAFILIHPFVNAQPGNAPRGMLIILIPLIIYGLGKVVAVVNHFVEWCRITTLLFAHSEVEFRTQIFGFGWSANHNLTGWDSLLVCLPADEKVKPELIAEGNPDAIRDFYDACNLWQVAFLDANEEQLLAIENLSKPEAMWMANVLLREQRVVR